MHKVLRYILLFTIAIHTVSAMAMDPYADIHSRVYTAEHPLIYEDAWEKWPYAFLNDDGEPSGFNVELIRLMMKRLDIPFEIRLRNQDDVHEDLKTRRADLSFGVNAGYNAPYGRFGKVTVTTFDNALIQMRADSIGPYKLSDLKDIPFSVKKDSRAHHYVIDNGFSDSLVNCVSNIEEEVLRVATEGHGAVLWNAMMLKWMVNKYHLTDLAVSPVDIPSGNYCFMSGDTLLLNRLDSLCEKMQKEGEIDRLRTHWMYPENKQTDHTFIYIIIVVSFVFFILMLITYIVHYYRKYYSRNTLTDINSQMGLVLQANHMQVWVYFPLTRRYAWMKRDGTVNEEYMSFDFSQFYPDQDFNIIHSQVMEFLAHDSEPVVKKLRSYSLNRAGKILDVEVHMQVLKDDYGKIYLICGVQHDITDSKAALERMRMLHERHKVAFNLAFGAILRFDGNGTLVDLNERCCIKMGIRDKQAVLAKKHNFADFGAFKGLNIHSMPNDIRFTAIIKNSEMSYYAPIASFENFNPDPEKHPAFYTENELKANLHSVPEKGYYYIHLVKSHDQRGNLLSVVMFMLDVTERVTEHKRLKRMLSHSAIIERDKNQYKVRRDYVLRSYGIWMVRYNPKTKSMVFYDSKAGVKYTFSQLRLLEFIDGKDMKRIFRAFHKVDSYDRNDIHLNVATLLRNEAGEQISYNLSIHPVYNHEGKVESYFGVCRNITDNLAIQRNLKHETKRAQESEHLRQTFLKNMSYSIRQPLVAIRENIKNYGETDNPTKEIVQLDSITTNISRLITLSDDTLLLSRIEANLLTPTLSDFDFAKLYKEVTGSILSEYTDETVQFRVDSIYDTLLVHADKDITQRILREAISLSLRYVRYGILSVRYMYRKERLAIAIEDNGHGIPPTILAHIFEPSIGGSYASESGKASTSGLEMPICKALVDLIGGTIDIESDPGKGTRVYIEIPVQEPHGKQDTAAQASQPE